VILGLAVLVHYRRVTDGPTEGRTDGQTNGHTTTAYTALAKGRAVKSKWITANTHQNVSFQQNLTSLVLGTLTSTFWRSETGFPVFTLL